MDNFFGGFYINALIVYLKDLTALMFLLIPFLLFAVLNAMIARQKRRSAILVFLFSLLLTPLIPYLYLLAVPSFDVSDRAVKNVSLSGGRRQGCSFFPLLFILTAIAIAVVFGYANGYFSTTWNSLINFFKF